MRKAARVDANQGDIVAALRKAGAEVYIIRQPVDLLVYWRGRWLPVEVKEPDKRGRINEFTLSQRRFFEATRGPVAVVYDAVGAIRLISELARP